MRVSGEALSKLESLLPRGARILDVGAGTGEHAAWFRHRGHNVVTVDYVPGHCWQGDFNAIWGQILKEEGEFDAVWASHILEHQPNPGLFLEKIFALAKEGGQVCITVPPRKDNLVGGHLQLYTPLSLVYNTILAGNDCSESSLKTYGYNISLITEKRPIELPKLKYDNGDIETLARFFPVSVRQNINGFKFDEVNW